jgi:hypothetical protein
LCVPPRVAAASVAEIIEITGNNRARSAARRRDVDFISMFPSFGGQLYATPQLRPQTFAKLLRNFLSRHERALTLGTMTRFIDLTHAVHHDVPT